MTAGKVEVDALFLGLTRPPLLFGVSYTFVVLNALISLVSFIVTTNAIFFLLFFILHVFSYYICLKEPRIMELMIIKGQKCSRCPNKLFHGYANSYDPY